MSKRDLMGYAFVTPLLLGLFIFHLYPIITVFILSLQNTNGVTGTYVGLSNYAGIFKDELFARALFNTVYMTVFALIFNVCLSFLLASMINSLPKGKSIFKGLFFLPNIVSATASALLFVFLFYPTNAGVINSILGFLGVSPLGWFSSPSLSRISVVMMGAWRACGYYFIIFLAGLQSVSRELYEAADIDGAGSLKKWWYITIPSVKPIFAFVIIIDTIASMRRFTDVYMIGGTGGNPSGTLSTAVTFIYRHAFTGSQMGVASAAATILFFIILLLSAINYGILNKPNDR